MQLSKKEILRERILNRKLKQFGLSLDSTIQDVYEQYENPVKGKKKIPAKLTSLGGTPMTISQYVAEVKQSTLYDPGKTISKLLSEVTKDKNSFDSSNIPNEMKGLKDIIRCQNTLDSITNKAYQKAEDNITLHAFELLFLTDYIISPTDTSTEHIKKCLASIAYGVNVAHLVAEIKNGNSRAKKKKARNPLTYPAIALFCKAASETIEPRNNGETNEDYCMRICAKYGLCHSDRVRQAFSQRGTKKHAKQVAEHILPKLPSDIQEKISTYLDGNAKMYG